MTPIQILDAQTPEQIEDAHRAGLVRRWHTNPDMYGCDETVGAHGRHCKSLAKQFFGDISDELGYECKFHDYGEYKTGDVPAPPSRNTPNSRKY